MLKSYVLVFALVLWCTALQADPPDPVWTRAFGGLGMQRGFALCNAHDGGVVLSGFMMPDGGTTYGPFSLKASAAGDSVWSCQNPGELQSAGTYYVRGIVPAPGGGYVAAGCSYISSLAPFLFKLAENGNSDWTRTYADWAGMEIRAIALTPDSQYVCAGSYLADVSVFKANSLGDTVWTRLYGGTGVDSGHAVFSMPNGHIVAAGSKQPVGGTGCRAFATVLDSSGTQLWSNSYGSTNYNTFDAIDRTFDGGFIFAGASDSLTAPESEVFVVRTDSIGTALWQRHYLLPTSGYTSGASAVKQQPDGGFVIAGWVRVPNTTNYDAFVTRLNASGDTVWTRTFGDASGDRFKALVNAPEGGFYVAGYYVGSWSDDFYIVRFPPETGIQGTVYNEMNGHVPNARVRAIGQTLEAFSDSAGHYILSLPAGTYDLTVDGPCVERDTMRSVTAPIDSVVTVDWTLGRPSIALSQSSINMVLHNHQHDSAQVRMWNHGSGLLDFSIQAVQLDPPGQWLTITPDSGSLGANDSLMFTVHLAPDTSDIHNWEFLGFVRIRSNACPDSVLTLPVSVNVLAAQEPPLGLPVQFGLSAYPNPFNPQTVLTLALPERAPVTLALYDVLGREVQTLARGAMEAGMHHLAFNGSALPSGLYFARVQTPKITKTVKLMLLK